MPLMLLAFLKNNWLTVALGVVIALMLVWVGVLKLEVKHYSDKATAYELVIDKYKAQEASLKEENKRITEAHAETLKRYVQEIKKSNQLIQEQIAKNEELKRTRLSLELIELWNKSKHNPDSPDTEQGDDGEATGTTKVATATLQDLFRVSAENDARHWACVKVVSEWQSLWAETVAAVTRNSNARSP